MKKLFIALLIFLPLYQVQANYDYICFTEEGDGQWSECGEGGFAEWDQTTGCRIYTGTRTQGAQWIWGNTREGCSGRRGFRGADVRTQRGGPTLDILVRGADGEACYQGNNGESFTLFDYNYDLDCLLEATAAEPRVDEQACRTQAGDSDEDLIVCLVDELEEVFTVDALLEIGGDNTPFQEEVCQFEQCDDLPPVCGSIFRDPFQWHNAEDFTGDDPLRCLLDESIGGGVGGDGNTPDSQEVFEYTGTDQAFTVPEGVTQIRVKAWGAGSQGYPIDPSLVRGSAGAYAESTVAVTPGSTLSVMVGEGGKYSLFGDQVAAERTYGFGGAAIPKFDVASGGGLSGVFTGDGAIAATDLDRALVVAGGGGGWGDRTDNSASLGGNGGNPNAGGATTMQGEDGVIDGDGGGGGGFAGGAGRQNRFNEDDFGVVPDADADAGEGGSSFGDVTLATTEEIPENRIVVPPRTDDPDYIDGVGDINGGHGLVVIEWAGGNGGEEVVVDEQVFQYTGTDQNYTIPQNCSSLRVKTWGAGGGGGYANTATSGAGGYSSGNIDVNPGDEYLVVVGEGGKSRDDSLNRTYGGGGSTNGDVTHVGGAGGGLSGIFTGEFVQENAIIIAGGGGGAGNGNNSAGGHGGAGGGLNGADGRPYGGSDDPQQGKGGTQNAGGAAGIVTDGVQSQSGSALQGGDGGFDNQGSGGGGGGYFGGGGGSTVDENKDGGGGGGSGYCAPEVAGCDTQAGNEMAPPNQGDPDYLEGVAIGAEKRENGGNGLVIIECLGVNVNPGGNAGGGFPGCIDNFDTEDQPAGCDPNSVGVNDTLDPVHDDICRMELCDYAGNCSICEPSPPLKYDATDPCTGANAGLTKTADGALCGVCATDDDDCHCIKGDASRCRDGGPINCYTNPFHDRCPGFQNPACLADPFTPGCPVVNPCYPTPVYDGLNCPLDAVRFCARNPYHYGCNLACADGEMDCDPVPPTGN